MKQSRRGAWTWILPALALGCGGGTGAPPDAGGLPADGNSAVDGPAPAVDQATAGDLPLAPEASSPSPDTPAGPGPDAGATPDAAADGPDVDMAAQPADATTADWPVRFRSGTRLQARHFAAGSARLFIAAHDKDTNGLCNFALASDGVLRCLPDPNVWVATGLFADSACRQPIVGAARNSCGLPQARLVTQALAPTADCQPGRHEVRALEPIEGVRTVYRLFAVGDCRPAPDTDLGTGRFTPGAEVPAARFVAGVDRAMEGPGRLDVRVVEGEDGFRQVTALWDPVFADTCESRSVGAGPRRCVPHARAVLDSRWWFADAGCQTPLAYATNGGCRPPVIGIRGAELFTPGERATGPVYQGRTAPQCQATQTDAIPWRLYAVGSALPASAVFALGTVALGDGRLAVQHTTDAAGTPLAAGFLPGGWMALHDREANQSCRPLRTTTGGARCVPPTVQVETDNNLYFADAACTQPLAYCGDDCTGRLYMRAQFSACGGDPVGESLARIGARYTGAQYWMYYGGRPEGSRCAGPMPTGDATLFQVGEPVGWDALPALEERTGGE